MTQLEEDNSRYRDGVNQNARLMVRNISFKATEAALRAHFSKHGTVEEVKLLKKPDGRLVGCGFVHFTYVDMANKALAATHKKPFLERPINVTWAVPKHKYAEKLETQKQGQGNVRKPQQKQRNEAEHPTDDVLFDEVDESKKSKEKNARVNRNARLIIRNVSFKATEESLKEHFEPYGNVLEVKLLKKPDGKLVGCAFVHFKNVPMAKKALLNTNMKPYLGRPISVDWAVAKDKYMQHIVNKQLEMQEDVKQESDSDDEGPMNTSNEALKDEIKSESDDSDSDKDSDAESDAEIKSESDNDDDDESKASDDEGEEDESDDDKDDESDDDDDEGDEDMETESQVDFQEKQRIKLNDAEDGCTVFLTNVSFSVDNEQLKQFAENTGPVKYALICMDKMTEHSKGSGFVKFENKEDADKFLALPANQLKLEGQVLLVKPALKRENLQTGSKKEAKDNRNLYLVKEGVIVAGTTAAEGVSSSDMAKRLALERSKTQMLKNLNRFVSRYRIVVSNLPPLCDDAQLRKLCFGVSGRNVAITEARVMRDLRADAPGPDGKYPSKGYGFVMFTRHEDALHCLRKLNNNPEIFDKNNRPIVSFSIEDRTALNARKKRLEKSIANNPLAQTQITDNKNKKNRKRKHAAAPDESYVKKRKFDKNSNQNQDRTNQNKNFDQNKNFNQNKNSNQNKNFKNKNNSGKLGQNQQNQEYDQYAGLTAKEGSQHKMRSNQKLKAQADLHRQTVKQEKKKSGRSWGLKMAAKERVKQPKQKINKDKSAPSRRNKKKFNRK